MAAVNHAHCKMKNGCGKSKTGDGTGIHHMKNPDDSTERHHMENPDDGTERHHMENPDDGTDGTERQKDITWKIQIMAQMLFAMSVHHAHFEKKKGHGTSRPLRKEKWPEI